MFTRFKEMYVETVANETKTKTRTIIGCIVHTSLSKVNVNGLLTTVIRRKVYEKPANRQKKPVYR